MRTRRWQSQVPGNEVPNDGAHQTGTEHVQAHVLANQIDAHQIAADGFRHARTENRESDEVEERCPYHCVPRRQHARRHNRRDRIRGVVKPVGEIKDQRDQNDRERNGYCRGHSCASKSIRDG